METESKTRATKRRRRSRTDRPTVEHVARAAGVSPMTVSRVVNRDPNVRDRTREKVRDAIEQLGYAPNEAARSLAGGKLVRIALLHSNPSAAYLSEFLVGSLAQAAVENVQLVVEFFGDAETAESLVERLVARRIDGVLLPSPLSDDEPLMQAIHDAGLALAQVATGKPAGFAHAVTIDDELAAYRMTRRLTGQGHVKIGFITGAANQTASARRLEGYRRALREAGIEPRDDFVVNGNFTYRSGWDCAERLLGLPDRPTAIFASNDDMAAAVIAVAHRLGIDVPSQLSVCGFDDTSPSTTIWPEITTIRQPIADMAKRAVARLAASSHDPDPHHDRLEFEMVVRGSDGRVAGET
ncbi:MAG: LacI family DNA-binding transcriptional regulator [Novosphingobium sp.]|nr:LacI family DNA-binding transcriptional regulator [Novosphingobium sp.]